MTVFAVFWIKNIQPLLAENTFLFFLSHQSKPFEQYMFGVFCKNVVQENVSNVPRLDLKLHIWD